MCQRRIRPKYCGISTYIQWDHVIEARRPDIMVVGKEDRVCKIIDVAVPADCRVNAKESEKKKKN